MQMLSSDFSVEMKRGLSRNLREYKEILTSERFSPEAGRERFMGLKQFP